MAVAREVFRKRGIRLEQIAVSRIERGACKRCRSWLAAISRWFGYRPTIPVFEGYEGAVKGAKDARLPADYRRYAPALPRGGLACLGVGMQSAATGRRKNGGPGSARRRIRKTCRSKKSPWRKCRSAAAMRLQLGLTIHPPSLRGAVCARSRLPWKSSPNNSVKPSKSR